MNDRFDAHAGGDAGRGHDAGGDAMPPFPPFPPEPGWLDQPLPPELADVDLGAFAARTLDAVRDEQQLDRDLAAIDRDLPRIVLAAHEVPPPAPDFVPSVLAALHQDRRARWQQLLARHIAPEPSPEFVARTLLALRDASGSTTPGATTAAGTTAAGTTAAAASPTTPQRALAAVPRTTADTSSHPSTSFWRRAGAGRWTRPLLAMAAALVVMLLLLRREPLRPLEARLAEHVPPIEAHASATSPLAFVLAASERRHADSALALASPDGVWLQLAGGR